MTRALSCLYKLPREQLGNVTKTVSEQKRRGRCSTHFPVQHIQTRAGLAPRHSELHQHLQNNGNNQRYLMAFEVCPCLSLGKQQEDFAGPQRAVTSKAAHAIQSNQRYSTERGDLLHKSWYVVEKQENKGRSFTHSSPCTSLLLTCTLRLGSPRQRVSEAHLTASKRTCKYSRGLCLLISARLFSQFGPQPVHTLKYLESVFFSLADLEVNIKDKYFISLNGQNHKRDSSGILGRALHQKKYIFN